MLSVPWLERMTKLEKLVGATEEMEVVVVVEAVTVASASVAVVVEEPTLMHALQLGTRPGLPWSTRSPSESNSSTRNG